MKYYIFTFVSLKLKKKIPILHLTGLCAEEIHLCGESAAIDLVTELMYTTGEDVEVT